MSLINLGIITIKNRDSGNYFKVILVSLILVVLYSFSIAFSPISLGNCI